jgi:Carboxypeptidase regulatory-like domain
MARRVAAIALFLLPFLGAPAVLDGAGEGRVYGVVADESGGVLPGVTVVATSTDGTVLATVTNAVGEYRFNGLPVGGVTLTFQLEGFSSPVVEITTKPGAELRIATQRLTVAARSETVDVLGTAPKVAPPAPPRAPLPPPPPPAVVIPVAEHDRDSICGPAKASRDAEAFGTIRSRRYGEDKGLYTKNDQVIVDGGSVNGITAGQNLVARRLYRVGVESNAAIGEHTAGLLQIVAAGERASIAVVIYTCDEVMRGDQLASFQPEPVRTPDAAGKPAFDNAARVLFADAGQLVGAPRRLMVIDRGRDGGVRAGQRVTLFRRNHFGGGGPQVIGDAVVVAVRGDSATIRVERATDAILFGDLAAVNR